MDATPFSIPGAKLGPHDENGPTFAKVVREYKLTDPAIDMIVKVVEDGIGYFMNDYRPKPDEIVLDRSPWGIWRFQMG